SGHLCQSSAVEMIKMRMRHQNQIDRRQMVNLKARLLQPLNYLQPFRPNRIHQHIELMGLDQERSVSNPGDTNLALPNFRKMRPNMIARPLGEKRRNENRRKE